MQDHTLIQKNKKNVKKSGFVSKTHKEHKAVIGSCICFVSWEPHNIKCNTALNPHGQLSLDDYEAGRHCRAHFLTNLPTTWPPPTNIGLICRPIGNKERAKQVASQAIHQSLDLVIKFKSHR